MTEERANGRVSTRDLLEAVNGSEERVTARIDKMDEKIGRRLDDHQTRLTVLETESAIEQARTRGIIGAVAGVKQLVLVTIAIAALLASIVGVGIAASEFDLHQRLTQTEQRSD